MAAPLSAKNYDQFIGEVGAFLNGSKVLTSFTHPGNYWLATGQTQRSTPVGVCIAGYTGCQYNEDVYMDNKSLWQVTSLAELGPGKFYFDYGADTIYLADDPTGHLVEATLAQKAFWQGGNYGLSTGVQIKGLVVEKFSTPAQDATLIGGLSSLIQGNEVRFNHGVGVSVYNQGQVINNWIHDMGQMGVSATSTTGVVFQHNEIDHANTMGFYYGWETGASKFAVTTGLVARDNYTHENPGGLWFDGDNYQYLVENNRVESSTYDGITVEISYAGVIRNNVVTNNGHCGSCWGAGILIGNASGAEIYGNTLSGNRQAILLIMYQRPESGRFGSYDLKDNHVHDNSVSLFSGQFGIKQYVNDTSYFTSKGNSFDFDHYTAGSLPAPFAWTNGMVTFSQLQGSGEETHGTWTG